MALDTKYNLRKESIYQVFTRCYSKEGTLKEVENNLTHIKDMGFTILYFLPLHEPGIINRKGNWGSPYSIRDYYKIDPKYGTMEDFERLVDKAHKLGLKIMTDIVINHTACDATWTTSNPEYYILDENNKPTRKIPDWSDIYDLDYSKQDLQDELIKMMCYWANKGVDAFRCDVAPIVPISFWKKVRQEVKKINPDFFMLAESGEQIFIEILREQNINVSTDPELYEAFDVCYCYDTQNFYNEAIKLETDLKEYGHVLNYSQTLLPKNGVKCWYLENHDQERIYSKLNNKNRVINWTCFMLLLKGMGFVYAGQEAFEDHKPSLFEKEDLIWDRDINFETLIKKCNEIKKDMFTDKEYVNCRLLPYSNILAFRQYNNEGEYYGYFDVKDLKERVNVDLKDGTYVNLLTDKEIEVINNELLINEPILIKTK